MNKFRKAGMRSSMEVAAQVAMVGTWMAFALTGCVSSSSARFESSKRSAKASDFPVEILDEKDIKRPYKVVGLVRVNAGARFNISDPLEILKQEGRKIGADALTSLSVNGVGAGVLSGGSGVYSGHVRDLWQAKAIVWTD